MESIGVGLIGSGYMGKCHALAWGAVRAVFGDGPSVRRVALCEVENLVDASGPHYLPPSAAYILAMTSGLILDLWCQSASFSANGIPFPFTV